MVVHIDCRGIKSDHQGPGDETDRVKKIHHLKSQHACRESKNEDHVTDPPEGTIIHGFGTLPLSKEEPIEEIDRGPHGTEPSAEEIAEDKDENENTECRQHSPDHLSLRKERDHPDERIESKVEIDRYLQFKGKSRADDEIQ